MHDDPTMPIGDAPARPAGMPELRDTWGGFKLLARVGSGGFGEVYRAWDPNLEREVALKLLLPGAVGGEEEYSAMLREARAMASVLHPNIVHVYGIDRHDNRVGFWTDFIKGKTLSALLGSQGPFGYREAALIGIDVSRALSAVHRAGLLHRDIKAENVMREEGGRILLMDFGLSAGERSLAGQIAGTPNYMAPELFEGEPATVCSDIYALGVLLYYLVIAEYPARLTGLTVAEAKAALARRTPLMDLRSDLPEPFLRAVRTAMDLDAGRRYGSAGQLADALAESLGTGMTTPTVPYTPVAPYNSGPAYTPVTAYSATPQTVQITPGARVPAPPPPPPPAPLPVGPPTWANLFGMVPWFYSLTRKKKWLVFCIVFGLGQQGWRALLQPSSTKTVRTSPARSDKSDAKDDGEAKDPDDSSDTKDVQELLAKAYKGNNVADAVKALLAEAKDDPSSAKTQADLGTAYLAQYRQTHDAKLLELARAAANKAIELDKERKMAEPHATIAGVDAAQGEFDAAMVQAKKAIAMAPQSAVAYGALSDVYRAQGKKADALTAANKAMALAPDSAEGPLRVGDAYFAAGDDKNAAAQWHRSLNMDPSNPEAYRNLGRANVRLDRLADAEQSLQKLVSLKPSASAYEDLGTVLMIEGRPSDAVKAYQHAVDLDSLDFKAWGTLARAQGSSGDREAAAKSYAKAIDLGEGERLQSPDNALVLAELAHDYAASGKSAQALDRVGKALALDAKGGGADRPSVTGDVAYHAGVTYELLGQRGRAFGLIMKALALGSHVGEIKHGPELAGLRSDGKFQAVSGRMGPPAPPEIASPVIPKVVIPKPPVPPGG